MKKKLGFGMFQHTMDRAVQVFDSYKTLYEGYEDELSLGQRFVAEYSVMKNEIFNKSKDFYIENIIDGESGSTDASVGKSERTSGKFMKNQKISQIFQK